LEENLVRKFTLAKEIFMRNKINAETKGKYEQESKIETGHLSST
jgi:hypothetical protein